MDARCGRELPGETQEAREGVLGAGRSRSGGQGARSPSGGWLRPVSGGGGSAPLPARSPAVWTRLQTRLLEGPLLRADSPRDGLARGPFPQRAWAPRAGGFEAQEGLWGQTEPPPTPQATSPAAAFEW
ncbi:hypothetical protein AB1E18_000825 [Capra hircus]